MSNRAISGKAPTIPADLGAIESTTEVEEAKQQRSSSETAATGDTASSTVGSRGMAKGRSHENTLTGQIRQSQLMKNVSPQTTQKGGFSGVVKQIVGREGLLNVAAEVVDKMASRFVEGRGLTGSPSETEAIIKAGSGNRVLDLSNAPKPKTRIMANNPIQLARAFLGNTESKNAKVLSKFIKNTAGQDLDVRKTAWCAAFVNAVLGASGIEGTGKLTARSFMKFGSPTDQPKVGDIAVFWRDSRKSWKGHVGFFAGDTTQNGERYIRVVGGNQDDSVSEKLYPEKQLLGFRQPPKLRTSMKK